MEKLKAPSHELTIRVLGEVAFEDRLIGFSLRSRSGSLPVTMYKFEEVVTLLNDPFPRLDWSDLERWIKNIIRDPDLVEEIVAAVKEEKSDRDRCLRIRVRMEERLNQCKKGM